MQCLGTPLDGVEKKKIVEQIQLGTSIDGSEKEKIVEQIKQINLGRKIEEDPDSSPLKGRTHLLDDMERNCGQAHFQEGGCGLFGKNSKLSAWDFFPQSMVWSKFIFGKDGHYHPNLFVRLAVPKPQVFSFISYQDRLKSFEKNWPKQMAQKPYMLAEAGFFYTGQGDICNTFCCNLLVHQWEYYDNPWEEHKKHSPSCELYRIACK